MSAPDYMLFPNGTSHMIWTGRNCDRCWKRMPSEGQGRNTKCCIETAIAIASITDGSLLHDNTTSPKKAAAIAARLNWDGKTYLETDCPEREEKRPKQHRKARQEKGTLSLL